MSHSHKKYIIIGAGPAGMAAHIELTKQGVPEANICHLEKEEKPGGKCKTYRDPSQLGLVTDYGAHWIASNYYEVIKLVIENSISLESVLENHKPNIPFYKHLAELSFIGKLKLAAATAKELYLFTQQAARYQTLRFKTPASLAEFELPFAEFAKKHGMFYIPKLLQPVLEGFGYGSIQDTPSHLIFAYLGKTILPELILGGTFFGNGMLGVQGGFQHFIEKLARKYPITTGVQIKQIQRNKENVVVQYIKDEIIQTTQAHYLIIATSPLQWLSLKMALTHTEQVCIEKLTYYRYPVAIVRIKGIEPKHYFFHEGLDHKNFAESLGEIALISTRDARVNPKEGRLCTVFQNLPKRNYHSLPIHEAKERELFFFKLNELVKKNNWELAEVVDYKVWSDYMPYLSAEMRDKLEKSQMDPNTRTLYCTCVLPGGFEDVGMSMEIAMRAVRKHCFAMKYNQPHGLIMGAAFHLLTSPKKPFPLDAKNTTDGQKLRSKL